MRIGINGFGRIGKNLLRTALERHPSLDIVAINDLASPNQMVHGLLYDSTYGRFDKQASAQDAALSVAGKTLHCFAEREPAAIPWNKAGVEMVLDCTGRFTDAAAARGHLRGGGVRKVIISAPAKGEDLTVVMGVNDQAYDPDAHHVLSNASCTTNALACVTRPLIDSFGWHEGMMSTVHAYTSDQSLLDGPHSDPRRARAAAVNMIPTSSGAAKALFLAVPETKGTFDGFAVRVPTATVSLLTLVAHVKQPATAAQVNASLKQASESDALRPVLGYCELPLVSSDFRRSPLSAMVDAALTQCVGSLVQVCAWYDNEWGYACRLADLAALVSRKG